MFGLIISQQAHYEGVQTKAANDNPLILETAIFYQKASWIMSQPLMHMQEAVDT